jgi:hypothetical protein
MAKIFGQIEYQFRLAYFVRVKFSGVKLTVKEGRPWASSWWLSSFRLKYKHAKKYTNRLMLN